MIDCVALDHSPFNSDQGSISDQMTICMCSVPRLACGGTRKQSAKLLESGTGRKGKDQEAIDPIMCRRDFALGLLERLQPFWSHDLDKVNRPIL